MKDPEPISRLRARLEDVRKANVTSQAKEEKTAKSPEAAKTRSKSSADSKSTSEKAEKKSVKESEDKENKPAKAKETATDESSKEKKKPSQRFFQCVYVPGRNAQYPLRPLTPAMSPAMRSPSMMSPSMMSPAIRSMLEQQQKAARASGQ